MWSGSTSVTTVRVEIITTRMFMKPSSQSFGEVNKGNGELEKTAMTALRNVLSVGKMLESFYDVSEIL